MEPTPYQRDLSKPHVKRLQEVIKKLGRFVDPIVVVSRARKVLDAERQPPARGARKLKAEQIPAILIPEPEVAYQILALNTEKAHNVKEKSLEVIRMYRGLVGEGARRPRRTTRSSSRRPTSSRSASSTRRARASRAARSRRSCAAWTSS